MLTCTQSDKTKQKVTRLSRECMTITIYNNLRTLTCSFWAHSTGLRVATNTASNVARCAESLAFESTLKWPRASLQTAFRQDCTVLRWFVIAVSDLVNARMSGFFLGLPLVFLVQETPSAGGNETFTRVGGMCCLIRSSSLWEVLPM